MVGARFNVEGFKIGRAKKLSIDDEGANRLAIAIFAEFIERDVLGNRIGVLVVEKSRNSRMAVIVTGLGLGCANATEFELRIEGLIGARTEQHFRLLSQMLLKQKPEANRWAGAKRNQARRSARRWIEIVWARERRSFRSIRDR